MLHRKVQMHTSLDTPDVYQKVNKVVTLGSGSGFGVCQSRGDGGLGEQFSDALGELSAVAGPVVDAVALEVDGGGGGAGIVDTDDFNGAAVAGAILFNDNDAVVGLLASANARQTNHQHRKTSRTNEIVWEK